MKRNYLHLTILLIGIIFIMPNAVGQTTTGDINPNYSQGYGDGKSVFYGVYEDARNQYLYTVDELAAAGLVANDEITSLWWHFGTINSSIPYENFQIKIGHSGLNEMNAIKFALGPTTVFSGTVSTAGWDNAWVEFPFSTGFTWDGFSAIIIETCFDNTLWTNSDNMDYSYGLGPSNWFWNGNVHNYDDGASGCSMGPWDNDYYRPVMRVTYGNPSPPAQPGLIIGAASPVESTTQTYSISAVSGATSYEWTVPSGWGDVSGETGTSISVTAGVYNSSTAQAGDITVIAKNSIGDSPERTKAVTPTVPGTPSAISGTASQTCAATGQGYTVINIPGLAYSWTVPGDWTITSGGLTYSMYLTVGIDNGTISVEAVNNLGTSASTSDFAVTTPGIPATPGTISGSASPVESTTDNSYSISSVSGATSYTWMAPIGWSLSGATTNSMTATVGTYGGTTGASGNVSVTATNTCGTSSANTKAVTPIVPVIPSTITGEPAPNNGATGEAYYVTNVPDIHYTWSVSALTGWSITSGQGTNSIEVTVGSGSGNISVTPDNNLSTGPTRTLAVAPVNEVYIPSDQSYTGATWAIPLNAYYEYSDQTILYNQSDVNIDGTIKKISFYLDSWASGSGPWTELSQTIYMAHYSNATISAETDCVWDGTQSGVSDWTQVFDGNVPLNGTGWQTITLDNSFDYNNSDNLIIHFADNSGNWTSTRPGWRYKTTNNTVIYSYSTSDPANCGTGSYDFNYLPLIKIEYEKDCSYDIGSISGTASIDDGQNTTLTISGQSPSASIQWEWRPTGATDWISAVNTYRNSATYVGSYLGQNTDYRVALSLADETCHTTNEANSEYAVAVSENSAVNVWTGKTSTDWETGSNWTQGSAPSMLHYMYIGNEYANAPTLDGEGTVTASALTVQAGAILNYTVTAPQNPILIGSLTNYGTINQTGGGWFYFAVGSSVIYNSGTMTSLIFEVGAGTLTATSDIDVDAILVSGNATFDMDNNNLTASNGVQVTGGSLELGTGAWNVTGGNVSITGSGAFDASSATLTFSGSTEQTVTTNGSDINNVVVNNSNGIKLGDAMQIDGSLTLTDGSINNNGNRLTMTSTVAANLSGYSENNFIIATAAGPFRRYIGENSAYVFPMGLGAGTTNYYRMDMRNNSLSNGGTLYLDVHVETVTETGNNVDSRITAEEGGTPIINMWSKEWIILPNSEPTSGTFDIKLYIQNLISSEGLEDNKFTVFKRDDGSTDYADYGNGASTSTAIPTGGAAGRVTTGSEPYASKRNFEPPMAGASGGNGNDPLPIELLDFKADLSDDGTVDITWATASETNNEFFTIERSVDGVDFATIIERDGAGTSNHIIEYVAVDRKPVMGTSYYRLKQTDYDGAYEYSKIAVVTINESSSFRVWPNPATDHLQVQLEEVEGNSFLKIYNDEGRLVYQKEMDGSFSKLDIDLSGFDQGLYFISHAYNGTIAKTRFVKN